MWQKCPVCGGSGLVYASFYDPGVTETTAGDHQVSCRACDGRGVLGAADHSIKEPTVTITWSDEDIVKLTDEAWSKLIAARGA